MPRPLLFEAPHEPIANPNTGIISNAWYLWFMQLIQDFTTAGDIFGPGTSLDGQIVLFNGTSGTEIRGATGTGFVFATNGVYSVVSAASIADHVVMSDGANPAFPVNDGNGNFIYITYTP